MQRGHAREVAPVLHPLERLAGGTEHTLGSRDVAREQLDVGRYPRVRPYEVVLESQLLEDLPRLLGETTCRLEFAFHGGQLGTLAKQRRTSQREATVAAVERLEAHERLP